jgi:hypothetical protein
MITFAATMAAPVWPSVKTPLAPMGTLSNRIGFLPTFVLRLCGLMISSPVRVKKVGKKISRPAWLASSVSFTFPNNLPSAATAGRRVLIATAGFAALGLVTPDFQVPNGFLPKTNGTVNYTVAASGCATQRTGAVSITSYSASQLFQINQDGAPGNFAISSTSATVPPAGVTMLCSRSLS